MQIWPVSVRMPVHSLSTSTSTGLNLFAFQSQSPQCQGDAGWSPFLKQIEAVGTSRTLAKGNRKASDWHLSGWPEVLWQFLGIPASGLALIHGGLNQRHKF